MPVSAKIGGLPLISAIFDHGSLIAALTMIMADFGIVCLLMAIEGILPWRRSQYQTFLWNDTIFIPAYLFIAVSVLQTSPSTNGLTWLYTAWAWHAAALIIGFGLSVAIELQALENGQYTWSQELSPSKLWHTIIFGVVAYWLLSTIVPVAIVVISEGRWLALVGIAVVAAGFVYNMYLDATLPFPKDAHPEGTWIPWDWHRRIY